MNVEGVGNVRVLSVDPSASEIPGDGPVLLVGGFGRDSESIQRVHELLGERLAFFLPGGTDRTEVMEDYFDGLDESSARVDLRGVRVLVFGEARFLLVPGSFGGVTVGAEDGCGLSVEDLEDLDDIGDLRGVVSWTAPGEAAGAEGAPVGAPEISDLAAGASTRLFAYPPHAQAPEGWDVIERAGTTLPGTLQAGVQRIP